MTDERLKEIQERSAWDSSDWEAAHGDDAESYACEFYDQAVVDLLAENDDLRERLKGARICLAAEGSEVERLRAQLGERNQ